MLWLITITLLSIIPASAAGPLTIVVNAGRFGDIEKAACSEEQVNWWDDDLTDDAACTESFAATELRRFLAACMNVEENDIHLAGPGPELPTGDVFLLGSGQSNPMINKVEAPPAKEVALLTAESFRVRSVTQNGRKIVIIEGKGRVGTLYGVYAYLEKLGMRFFGLGEQGTVYPAQPVQLPDTLDWAENPGYRTRGFWAWEDRGNNDFFLWMARNRLNHWTATEEEVHLLKKLGLKLTSGQHDVQFRFLSPQAEYPYNHPSFQGDEHKPADPYSPGQEYQGDTNKDGKLTYYEAHPEWYALRQGQRSKGLEESTGDNYCTSNPEATGELCKNLIQDLIDGQWRYADILNFWMLDGGKWCQCQACKQQGTPTDRLLILMHTVLKELHDARQEGRLKRKVELVSLAYQETLPPPTHPLPENFDYENFAITFFPIYRCYVHPFADPACTEINRQLLEHYQGWTTKGGRYYTGSIFIGEYYNVSNIKSLPVLFPRIMAVDIPWYYRNGAGHFHYMHTPTRLWGTWTLNQYLLGRLLWNPQADADIILDEYFARYYPSTSESTRSFYHHLEQATANIKPFKHHVLTKAGVYNLRQGLTNDKVDIFPLKHLRYAAYKPATDDGPDLLEIVEHMQRARSYLDASLLACTDAVEKARLLEDERRFAYGEVMVMFYYHLVRTAMFHRRGETESAKREFVQVERMADKLKSIVDLVQVASSHANAEDGLAASYGQHIYDLYKKRYGAEQPDKAKK